MAKIQLSHRTVGTSFKPQPEWRGSATQAPGRALASLGKSISSLGSAMGRASVTANRQAEQDELFQFNADLQEFKNRQEMKFLESEKGYQGNGQDFSKNVVGSYDADWKKFKAEKVPTRLKTRAEVYNQRFRGGYEQRGFKVGQQKRGEWYVATGTKLFTTTILPRITGDIGSAESGLTAAEGIISSMDGIPSAVAAGLRKQAANAIFKKWLSAAGIEAGPQAQALLERYRATGHPYMAPKENLTAPVSAARSAPQSIPLSSGQKSRLSGVNNGVIKSLETVQSMFGKKLPINSGYRSPEHNKRVGGARHSQHIQRNAVDIDVSSLSVSDRKRLISIASAQGFKGIGVYKNAIHLDLGSRGSWGSDYSHRTVPSWARSVISSHLKGHFKSSEPSPSVVNRSGVQGVLASAAQREGIDPNLFVSFARIESGLNPRSQTGQYKGLLQLSDRQFRKYGGKGDVFDAAANAAAGARKVRSLVITFQKYNGGRAPNVTEIYLMHQQGVGGQRAHYANPDRPAWLNMYSTSEGQSKGKSWAKRAIWGNLSNDGKRRFGSVENVTSKEFISYWDKKIQRKTGGSSADVADISKPYQVASNANTAPPSAARSMSARDMFETLIIKNVDKISRNELRAMHKSEVEADRKERDLQSETRKDAYKLLFDKKLTPEWLDKNEHNLSDNAFITLRKAVTPMGRITDPKTFSELLSQADERPEEIIEEAIQAYARGDLTHNDYRVIEGRARRELDPAAAKQAPWVKEQRSSVKEQLKPKRGAPKHEREQFAEALKQYDEYVERMGEDVDRDKLTKFAAGLVDQTRIRAATLTRSSMDLPRFAEGVTRSTITPESIDAAIAATVQARQSGAIDATTFKAEARKLKAWSDALAAEAETFGTMQKQGAGKFAAPPGVFDAPMPREDKKQ